VGDMSVSVTFWVVAAVLAVTFVAVIFMELMA
jgi:hypothetical protein